MRHNSSCSKKDQFIIEIVAPLHKHLLSMYKTSFHYLKTKHEEPHQHALQFYQAQHMEHFQKIFHTLFAKTELLQTSQKNFEN